MTTQERKDAHITINLEKPVNSGLLHGFEHIHFVHQGLPELDADTIDTRVVFLGHKLSLPLLISSMTGGTERAKSINQCLARAAQDFGLGMALGSMRVLLENPETFSTFDVRKVAPRLPLLFANLGAIQLNYGVTPEDCQRLVDLVRADALVLHLNPLQESVQPEGDNNWSHLTSKIERVVKTCNTPVIVKEVGYGISSNTAKRLINAGVQAIDLAGAGGTSWSEVEAYRSKTDLQKKIAQSFIHWGIPTYESLRQVRRVSSTLPVIASGGIRTGIDAAKALHSGAHIVGMAAPFLKAAALSDKSVHESIQLFQEQLRITMLCTASKCLEDLTQAKTMTCKAWRTKIPICYLHTQKPPRIIR